MASHTPGPWGVKNAGLSNTYRAEVEAFAERRCRIVTARIPTPRRKPEEAEANARLIAAAPDLLAALRMVCDSGVPLAEVIENAMTAAISKAEGR